MTELVKKIFISHSTKDKLFVKWMSNLLACFGIGPESIFCSSDYRSGVFGKIPDEISWALESTVIDIIILSDAYKKSEYCLNEAGIIWFKGARSEKIIVVIPEISGEKCAGFMDAHYKQYRIFEPDFLDALVQRLEDILIKKKVIRPDMRVNLSCFRKRVVELEQFKKSLPIIENLSIYSAGEFGKERELHKIKQAWENIQKVCGRNPNFMGGHKNVFYKSYGRTIVIYAAEDPQKIQVKTTTEYVIVNLSNENYTEDYSSLFIKEDGGYDTYKVIEFEVNGKPYEREGGSVTVRDSYVTYKNPGIVVDAHSNFAVKYVTTYNIEPGLFFQSKVLRIPCGVYSIQANFDVSFTRKFGTNYIFRSQFIPPDPSNLDACTVPHENFAESPDKRNIHFKCEDGFPAGSGYVLSISKTNETE